MIIDTNAITAWAECDEDIKDLIERTELAFPVIAIGEYLFGLRRSRRREQLERWIARAISSATVLPVGLDTAESYASVRAMLQDKGRPIPDNDAWIAALALEYDMPVLSRDKHFDVVDGLERVSW